MPENEPMTTAEALAAFYRELISSGIPDMLAHELVADAGRRLLNGEGYLSVKQASHV